MLRERVVLVVVLLSLMCFSGALVPVPAHAQSADAGVEGVVYLPSLKSALDARPPATLKAKTSKDDIVNRVVLPPIPDQRRMPEASKGAPQQIGFPRAIALDDAQQVAPARLRWTPAGSSTVTAFSITSPGASALRVSLAFQTLPDGAEIRFFGLGTDDTVFGPFTLSDIRALEVKEGANGVGLFWSPVIEGDTVAVELFLPMATQRDDVRFTLGNVSHLVASAIDVGAVLESLPARAK